jgi:sec-independent protein translocase protein TatB
MSGISFWELVIIFVIGLIVLGPERLPRVANQLGTWLGQARRMTRVMRRQLEEELNLEKELSIRPQTSRKALPEAAAAVRDDDTYSPAHGADDLGTGAGDTAPAQDPQEAAAPAPGSGGKQEEAAGTAAPDRNA